MMQKYPAGRFMILYGVNMLIMTIFVWIAWSPLEKWFGERIVPYLVFALIGALLLVTISCYRNLKPRTTIILGTIGWIATFIVLYVHYSQETFK
jgi:hypothetical protein